MKNYLGMLGRTLGWVTALAAATPLAWAEGIYRYVEKDGTVVYTNVPPSRGKAKKIKGNFQRPPDPQDPPAQRPPFATDYDDHVERFAKRYRIPANLLRAVMHAESNFDPSAVSPKGPAGLM